MALFLTVGPALLPASTEAQRPPEPDPPDPIVKLESDYRSADRRHREAVEAHDSLHRQWGQAVDSAVAAEDRGNRGKYERDMARAHKLAKRLQSADRDVQQQWKRMDGIRERLRDEYEKWLDDLFGRLPEDSIPPEGGGSDEWRRLEANISHAQERIAELEEAAPVIALPPPAAMVISPRDGRKEIERKLADAQRRVAQLDKLSEEVDQQLSDLERRRQQELTLERMRRGTKRFLPARRCLEWRSASPSERKTRS